MAEVKKKEGLAFDHFIFILFKINNRIMRSKAYPRFDFFS